MKNINYILYILYSLIIAIHTACSPQNSNNEKFHDAWDKVVDVKERIHEINTDSVLISGNSTPYITNKYLLITDSRSFDYTIYAFDKKTFHYQGCFAHQGEGPNEITRIGNLGINDERGEIYITDHGKQKIVSCNVDSALMDSSYVLKDVASLKKTQFPSEYTYINDTLCIGRFIFPIGDTDYKPHIAKWNMHTGEYKIIDHDYPNMKYKRISCGVSLENSLYVEAYTFHDLFAIADFEGNLKYNIYGPNWELNPREKIHYYDKAVFRKGQIIIGYSGGNNQTDAYYSTMFHVFDLDGNYLKTLNVGYKILRYCYDKDNDRLVICFNDEIQYGYLDLKDLI